MAIQVEPELEALIQEDIVQGPYQSAEEFLERAVHMLHDQELWLRENRDEVAAKIEQGYSSAERGDLASATLVRARMEERKGRGFRPVGNGPVQLHPGSGRRPA